MIIRILLDSASSPFSLRIASSFDALLWASLLGHHHHHQLPEEASMGWEPCSSGVEGSEGTRHRMVFLRLELTRIAVSPTLSCFPPSFCQVEAKLPIILSATIWMSPRKQSRAKMLKIRRKLRRWSEGRWLTRPWKAQSAFGHPVHSLEELKWK